MNTAIESAFLVAVSSLPELAGVEQHTGVSGDENTVEGAAIIVHCPDCEHAVGPLWKATIVFRLESPAFDNDRDAQAKLQKEFEADLAKGYADKDLGITIAIGDGDRQQFNDLEQHLTRKAVPDDQIVAIKLLDGSLHQITRGQFHELLIRAGDYYLSLWSTLQQKKAAL